MFKQLKPVEVFYNEIEERKKDVYSAFRSKNPKELAQEYLKYALNCVKEDGNIIPPEEYKSFGYGEPSFLITLFFKHAVKVSTGREGKPIELELFIDNGQRGFDVLKKGLLWTIEDTFVKDEDGVFEYSTIESFEEKLKDNTESSIAKDIVEDLKKSKDFYSFFGFYETKYKRIINFLESVGEYEDMSEQEIDDLLRMNGYEQTMKELKAVENSLYQLINSIKEEVKK